MTEITMTDGKRFLTDERMETVVQTLERRSYAELQLRDGTSVYVNPVQVTYVRSA